ncbi:hypothetical protein L1987_42915 [Smallanthus sonchifolius]|uniref:Uncharacterized protein n=1 Tax=Smallanthus sonchifolius TaxID=185202 RepID=A0ACB9GK98_9ASTR|nr:hypothetical protein L1987_42915 [Smallanthus sonchifolius]
MSNHGISDHSIDAIIPFMPLFRTVTSCRFSFPRIKLAPCSPPPHPDVAIENPPLDPTSLLTSHPSFIWNNIASPLPFQMYRVKDFVQEKASISVRFLYNSVQPAAAPVPTTLTGWMSNPPAVSHPTLSGSAIGLAVPLF